MGHWALARFPLVYIELSPSSRIVKSFTISPCDVMHSRRGRNSLSSAVHSNPISVSASASKTSLEVKQIEGSDVDSSIFEVVLEDHEDPKNMSVWKKWCVVLVICSGAICATCASTMVRAAS